MLERKVINCCIIDVIVFFPFFLFFLLITIMIWRAVTGLQVSVRNQAWEWTKLCSCVGSILFGISDLILGMNKFYLPIPSARAIVMVTYYGAQLGIALSSFTVEQVKVQKTSKEKSS